MPGGGRRRRRGDGVVRPEAGPRWARGHLYARKAAANTWNAQGPCYLAEGDRDAADAAFRETLARVPSHPLAHTELTIWNGEPPPVASVADLPEPVDHAIARAARLVHASHAAEAIPVVSAALTAAPAGNGGRLLAVEPLLRVAHEQGTWAPALAVVHLRAR